MQKDMRKSPEKICLVLDEGIRRWVLPNQVKYYPNAENIEFIRADLVEPSYGAEKIIRGNGKVQDEYILTSLHDKKVEHFKQLTKTYRRILNAKGTKAEEI